MKKILSLPFILLAGIILMIPSFILSFPKINSNVFVLPLLLVFSMIPILTPKRK